MTRYRIVQYYEEWLAGHHSGHQTKVLGCWACCETCKRKFRLSQLPPAVDVIPARR